MRLRKRRLRRPMATESPSKEQLAIVIPWPPHLIARKHPLDIPGRHCLWWSSSEGLLALEATLGCLVQESYHPP